MSAASIVSPALRRVATGCSPPSINRTPDAPAMERPIVRTAKVEEGRDVIQDLDQYIVR